MLEVSIKELTKRKVKIQQIISLLEEELRYIDRDIDAMSLSIEKQNSPNKRYSPLPPPPLMPSTHPDLSKLHKPPKIPYQKEIRIVEEVNGEEGTFIDANGERMDQDSFQPELGSEMSRQLNVLRDIMVKMKKEKSKRRNKDEQSRDYLLQVFN